MGPVDWTQVVRVGDECLSLLDMPSHQPCFVLIFFLLLIWEFHTILIIFNPLPQLLGPPLPLPSYPLNFMLSSSPSLHPSSFPLFLPPSSPLSLSLCPSLSRTVCIGQLLLDLGPTMKYTNDPPSKKTDSSFPKCYQMPIFPQLRVGLLSHFFFFFLWFGFCFWDRLSRWPGIYCVLHS